MSGWAWLNGTLGPAAEARVSIWDRGFLYGDGVFETVRVYDGTPFRLPDHLSRLRRGLDRCAIGAESVLADVRTGVADLLQQDAGPNAMLRIMVTRGECPGGWRGDMVGGPTVLAVLWPAPLPPPAWYEAGVSAVWCDGPAMQAAWWPTDVKHNNWLPRVLAKQQVDAAGAYEGFLHSADGGLAEGLTSNVFVVQGGALRTPPVEAGVLPGITRSTVLRLAQAAGIPVCEAAVSAAAVAAAEEILCTHAGLGPFPVTHFERQPVGAGAGGPVWRTLHQAYFAEARS